MPKRNSDGKWVATDGIICNDYRQAVQYESLKSFAELFNEVSHDYNDDLALIPPTDMFNFIDGNWTQLMSIMRHMRSFEPDEETHDPCPECGVHLVDASGGGVRCPNPGCGYWFCY